MMWSQDGNWTQLGAPNTNRNRPGINPAFPAYPSGHATFGTAVLQIVKLALNQPGVDVYPAQKPVIAVNCGYPTSRHLGIAVAGGRVNLRVDFTSHSQSAVVVFANVLHCCSSRSIHIC